MMDEGSWSIVLGTLRESTIPSWSRCCNKYQKLTVLSKATVLAYGQTGSGMREQGRSKEVKRILASLPTEPRSSSLKDKKRGEGEIAVKKHFVNDMIDNNRVLCVLLEKEYTCYAVLWDSAHIASNSPCFSTTIHAKCGSAFRASCLEAFPPNSSTNDNIMVGRK